MSQKEVNKKDDSDTDDETEVQSVGNLVRSFSYDPSRTKTYLSNAAFRNEHGPSNELEQLALPILLRSKL